MSSFQISALPQVFNHLFELTDDALAQQGMIRMKADTHPGYPCRVSLEDTPIGEEVILLPWKHLDSASPYQASGPLFVRKGVTVSIPAVNEIPKMLTIRLLSLRVYNEADIMIDAKTVAGEQLKDELQRVFQNDKAHYIHLHNAGPGCYNCRVDRA